MPNQTIYPANGLEINFLGLPMVLNDGKTENKLQIALTNNNFFLTLQDKDATIVFTPETPVFIWFVVDTEQASGDAVRTWALTSAKAFHDAKVSLTIEPNPANWEIARKDDLPGNPLNSSLNGWTLKPTGEIRLALGETLVVTLDKLTTDLPDGPASCYCQVSMPHRDAYGEEAQQMLKVIGPITKSRMMIAGDRVGIGTASPGAELEVNG